jgi:transcriptional regulator with XRE-family HTH domain
MEIAEELGLDNPNIITMFKQGKTKVPLERVPALAKVLGIDPSMLMRKAMEEYCPDFLKACEETLLGSNVSKNELAIVNEIRALSGNSDPAITSIEHKIAVGKFVKKLIQKPKTSG